MGRNWVKFAVAGAVIAGALGYLFLTGMRTSMVYYLTLEEYLVQEKAAVGDGVRLAGWVRKGSIAGSALDGALSFVMTDGVRELPVTYRGQVPDTFAEEAEVVVEGVHRGRPIFEAATLLAKCPSKYEEAGPRPSKAAN